VGNRRPHTEDEDEFEEGQLILGFKLSPCLVFSVLSFGCFPGGGFILADVSEHSICSIFKADHEDAN
jgi:hypothetical protein